MPGTGLGSRPLPWSLFPCSLQPRENIPHIITNMMRDTKRKAERLSNVLMWRFQEGLPEEVAFQAESQRMTSQFGMLWVAHNRKSYQQ